MNKETAYLMKFSSETNTILEEFFVKLGWGKKESFIRLIQIFSDVINYLDKDTELVLTVRRTEDPNVVLKEQKYPHSLLKSHKCK